MASLPEALDNFFIKHIGTPIAEGLFNLFEINQFRSANIVNQIGCFVVACGVLYHLQPENATPSGIVLFILGLRIEKFLRVIIDAESKMKANMRNPLKAIEEIVARLTRSLILLSLTLYVLFSAQQVLGYKWFSLGLLLILISDFIAACDWPSGKMKTAAVYN